MSLYTCSPRLQAASQYKANNTYSERRWSQVYDERDLCMVRRQTLLTLFGLSGEARDTT